MFYSSFLNIISLLPCNKGILLNANHANSCISLQNYVTFASVITWLNKQVNEAQLTQRHGSFDPQSRAPPITSYKPGGVSSLSQWDENMNKIIIYHTTVTLRKYKFGPNLDCNSQVKTPYEDLVTIFQTEEVLFSWLACISRWIFLVSIDPARMYWSL